MRQILIRIFTTVTQQMGDCISSDGHAKGVDPFKTGEAIMPAVDAIPEIIEGKHTEEDVKADGIRMRENNYKCLGYSSFSAGEVSRDNAIAFGKEIHAEKIIFMSNIQILYRVLCQ